jgi:hypothetical protein
MSDTYKTPSISNLAGIIPDMIRYNIRVIFGSKFLFPLRLWHPER